MPTDQTAETTRSVLLVRPHTEVPILTNKRAKLQKLQEEGKEIPSVIRVFNGGDLIQPDDVDEDDWNRLISIGVADAVEDLEEQAEADREVAKLEAKAAKIRAEIDAKRQAGVKQALARQQERVKLGQLG